MKDKTLAGILALFFGWMGVHRFYLGQVGLGIVYLFLIPVAWLLGIIDALAFFSMDQEEFDRKYNKEYFRRREEDRDWNRRNERDYARRERTQDRQQSRQTRKAEPAPPPSRENPYRDSGVKKFKDYDYEGAIEDFEKSLQISPKDIATHFNIACAYSLMENKDKAFYHLDRAVAQGFDDRERIKTHDALAFLRIQDEFQSFEQNGFRLAAQVEQPAPDLLSSQPTMAPSLSQDLLEQLKRLGELRERGLLTEEEFSTQKKKLLG